MERIHPNLSNAAACALFALVVGFSGCHSSSSGVAGSPFMSPDRVPPPNTRMLAPGQAQPYYQGDPLPPMQSAVNRSAEGLATSSQEKETLTTSGRTLTWAQPPTANPAVMPEGAIAATSAPPAPQPQKIEQAPRPEAIGAANEAAVGIPNDGDPLRFSLPVQSTSDGIAPISSTTPIAPQSQQNQPFAMQPPPAILQASYTKPLPVVQPPPLPGPAVSRSQPDTGSPWRSPQIVPISTATALASGVSPPLGAAPLGSPVQSTLPANTMAATIRAVEPPAQAGDPMPRVRVPGYMGTETSSDGFRPRTSMQ